MATDIYSRAWDLTELVLGAVQAEFALAEVALPARQFATSGIVIYDTEQLSVSLLSMGGADLDGGQGTAGEEAGPQRCVSWRGIELEVMLLRCAPTVDVMVSGELRAPDADEQAASGQLIAKDASIITSGLLRAHQADTFGMGPTMSLQRWDAVGDADLTGGAMRLRLGLI